MANSSNENPPSSPTNPLNNDAGNQTPPPPPPPPTEVIQESNSAPPATPPPAINSGTGGSSGEGSNPKKKRRGKKPREAVEDQQGSGQKRKRGEMDAPKREPVCCVCGKKFASWKAVFGHFRAHGGREWRGAFPPPTGDALAWLPPNLPPEETLAPTLLRLAREALDKMTNENLCGAGSGSGSRVVFDFDLNMEPPPEEEADVAAGSTANGGGDDGGLNLNRLPLEEHKDVEMAEDKGEGDAA